MCSRQGVIQIHVYLTLPYLTSAKAQTHSYNAVYNMHICPWNYLLMWVDKHQSTVRATRSSVHLHQVITAIILKLHLLYSCMQH